MNCGKRYEDINDHYSVYDLSYIHLHSSPSTDIITNSPCDHLPVGLIAQLVEHLTGIAEVAGLNPTEA